MKQPRSRRALRLGASLVALSLLVIIIVPAAVVTTRKHHASAGATSAASASSSAAPPKQPPQAGRNLTGATVDIGPCPLTSPLGAKVYTSKANETQNVGSPFDVYASSGPGMALDIFSFPLLDGSPVIDTRDANWVTVGLSDGSGFAVSRDATLLSFFNASCSAWAMFRGPITEADWTAVLDAPASSAATTVQSAAPSTTSPPTPTTSAPLGRRADASGTLSLTMTVVDKCGTPLPDSGGSLRCDPVAGQAPAVPGPFWTPAPATGSIQAFDTPQASGRPASASCDLAAIQRANAPIETCQEATKQALGVLCTVSKGISIVKGLEDKKVALQQANQVLARLYLGSTLVDGVKGLDLFAKVLAAEAFPPLLVYQAACLVLTSSVTGQPIVDFGCGRPSKVQPVVVLDGGVTVSLVHLPSKTTSVSLPVARPDPPGSTPRSCTCDYTDFSKGSTFFNGPQLTFGSPQWSSCKSCCADWSQSEYGEACACCTLQVQYDMGLNCCSDAYFTTCCGVACPKGGSGAFGPGPTP